MPDLSIIIPARNEKYLENTIDDILENAEGDIEVLVGLDGCDDKEMRLLSPIQHLGHPMSLTTHHPNSISSMSLHPPSRQTLANTSFH